jgi:hypothetical protein
MSDTDLNNEQKISIINAHIIELKAEQYSHEIRKIELETIQSTDNEIYQNIVRIIGDYDNQISVLESLKANLQQSV